MSVGEWCGGRGPEYVSRLQQSCERHLPKHRFVCITDEPEKYDCETLESEGFPGWWAKIQVFTFDERVIFFDLDTMILGDLGFLADYDGDFAILRGFYQSFRFGSGVMSIAPGFGRHVYDEFKKRPQWSIDYCGWLGDGHWMQLCLGERDRLQDLFPGKFVSYKAHCHFGIPKDAAVLCFHGQPRPHETDLWNGPLSDA